MKIKFICTGLCGCLHPIHDHCKECHHAEFKTSIPYRHGKVTIWHNMLHGPMFYVNGKSFYPSGHSILWKVWRELFEFAERNCEYWMKRNKNKGGAE